MVDYVDKPSPGASILQLHPSFCLKGFDGVLLQKVLCLFQFLDVCEFEGQIIHRDLSPNNILLSRDSVAKISDLGVAKVVQADSKATQTMLTKVPGTADFMPPESFAEIPNYEISLDIFSYGGIVLHVVRYEGD